MRPTFLKRLERQKNKNKKSKQNTFQEALWHCQVSTYGCLSKGVERKVVPRRLMGKVRALQRALRSKITRQRTQPVLKSERVKNYMATKHVNSDFQI